MRQVGQFPELLEDARSEKYLKKNPGNTFFRALEILKFNQYARTCDEIVVTEKKTAAAMLTVLKALFLFPWDIAV